MNQPNLDARLMCAADLVNQCRTVADIGTDHAYLPIYLVNKGICTRAVAADINKGPIERAKLNIRAVGLTDKIDTELTDGLHGIEKYEPDCILILGMGGELIVKIISEAPWICAENKNIRLVLQPMTHPETVRTYLWDNGFEISDEKICKSGKLYCVFAAHYTGTKTAYSAIEALIGKETVSSRTPLATEYKRHIAKIYERRLEGLKAGGCDFSKEQTMLDGIENII